MEWWLIISLLFGGMVFLLFTNLPIAFAFLVVNIIGAYFFLGGLPGLVGVVTGAFTSITTFTLLPVPFFILMGELIFHSGLGLNAVNVLDKWLGNLRGRLSLLAIIMGVIIGALSGSTIATCALLGTILLPQMLEKGYSKNMSLGPLMGVGTVDALIPPNALTVVLASLAKIDVGQLLIAGILPGIIMSALYFVYVLVWCRLFPKEAPMYVVPKIPLREKVTATAAIPASLKFHYLHGHRSHIPGSGHPHRGGGHRDLGFLYPGPDLQTFDLGYFQEVGYGDRKGNGHDFYDYYRLHHLRGNIGLYRCCRRYDRLYHQPGNFPDRHRHGNAGGHSDYGLFYGNRGHHDDYHPHIHAGHKCLRI